MIGRLKDELIEGKIDLAIKYGGKAIKSGRKALGKWAKSSETFSKYPKSKEMGRKIGGAIGRTARKGVDFIRGKRDSGIGQPIHPNSPFGVPLSILPKKISNSAVRTARTIGQGTAAVLGYTALKKGKAPDKVPDKNTIPDKVPVKNPTWVSKAKSDRFGNPLRNIRTRN